jgi:hypothetical protein
MIEAKKHYLDKHVEPVALLAKQTQEEIVRYEVDINRMMGNKRRREEDFCNDMVKLAKARVTYTILEESEKVAGEGDGKKEEGDDEEDDDTESEDNGSVNSRKKIAGEHKVTLTSEDIIVQVKQLGKQTPLDVYAILSLVGLKTL